VLEVERKGSVVAWARQKGWIGQALKLVEPWMLEEADRWAEQNADYQSKNKEPNRLPLLDPWQGNQA